MMHEYAALSALQRWLGRRASDSVHDRAYACMNFFPVSAGLHTLGISVADGNYLMTNALTMHLNEQ